ncbi:MAG: hypothetical protein Q8Q09_15095 [Deltaproteobacteria bacterium]|nr:hypothetical protein [Deltaproteobacteria bacterium]
MPHEECVSGGGDIRTYSVGTDRPIPVRDVTRSGRLFCREVDANFDGRVDLTRFFDEQGRTRLVEDDYDFDGRVDVVATYQNGQVVSDILDTNFDGRTDTWRFYSEGRVVRQERDANNDRLVDMWEEFDAQGNVTRTLTDANGDGRPDEPATETPAPASSPNAPSDAGAPQGDAA